MLGIVIANWNGEKLLKKCFESLFKQLYKDFKIFIIDNGSKDNSIEIIKQFESMMDINLIELNENSGFAHANNLGISLAIQDGCEYILTLNNDIEIEEECIVNAFEVIKNSECDVFQLLMINYFDREKCDSAGLIFKENLIVKQIGFKSSIKDLILEDDKIDGACAGAAIYTASALEKVKLSNGEYFDSSYFAYYEDVDLALRLKRAGYLACLLKKSIVYHMHSATSKTSNGFKEYYLTRNLFLYAKRNQNEFNYKKNMKFYRFTILKLIIKNILKLNRKAIYNIIKGYINAINEVKQVKYVKYDLE